MHDALSLLIKDRRGIARVGSPRFRWKRIRRLREVLAGAILLPFHLNLLLQFRSAPSPSPVLLDFHCNILLLLPSPSSPSSCSSCSSCPSGSPSHSPSYELHVESLHSLKGFLIIGIIFTCANACVGRVYVHVTLNAAACMIHIMFDVWNVCVMACANACSRQLAYLSVNSLI